MAAPNPPVVLAPFNDATARVKIQLAEDAWNTRDPERVAVAYTEDSQWRNRDEFFQGREAIRAPIHRRDASINDYPVAPSERRVALP